MKNICLLSKFVLAIHLLFSCVACLIIYPIFGLYTFLFLFIAFLFDYGIVYIFDNNIRVFSGEEK